MNAERRESLEKVRRALLHVHRALLQAERLRYEKQLGRIESNGAFLQLLLQDPWFQWLRPVSELIVQIDDWLDEDRKAPGAADLADSMLAQARERLTPNDQGSDFQRRYFQLLQEDPAVAVAAAEVRHLV